MNTERIKELLDKYAAGTCTEHERILLELWFEQECTAESKPITDDKKEQIWENIREHQENKIPVYSPVFRKWLPYAAAILLLVLSAALIFQFGQRSENRQQLAIVPGSEQATLTSTAGEKINLNQIENEIVTADGLKITRDTAGQLIVAVSPNAKQSTKLNQITTPRGGQFQILLSDGTKVYLNAASILRFPSDLKQGATRTVSLSGEAYFEVAKDPKRPFIVNSNKQHIQVYGTQFNLNTYSDVDITTLIEGKVSVNSIFLKPGEQSSIGLNSHSVAKVDVENFIDWKNNKFIFQDEPLISIMQRVSRWYDIDYTFADADAKNVRFSGEISRYSKIEEILDLLQQTSKVRFQLNKRTVRIQ